MAKNENQADTIGDIDESEKLDKFSPEIKLNIDFIIKLENELEEKQEALKMKKEEIKESYKAIAEKLSISPKELKERLRLIHQTDETPEILPAKKNSLTFVELYNEAGGIPEDSKKKSTAIEQAKD